MSEAVIRLGDGLGRGRDASPADILTLAFRLLRRGGWIQHDDAVLTNGAHCVVLDARAWSYSCAGAIGRAAYVLRAPWMHGLRAAHAFCAVIGASPHGGAGLRAWERRAGRTETEISEAFEAAIYLSRRPLETQAKGVLLNAVA